MCIYFILLSAVYPKVGKKKKAQHITIYAQSGVQLSSIAVSFYLVRKYCSLRLRLYQLYYDYVHAYGTHLERASLPKSNLVAIPADYITC